MSAWGAGLLGVVIGVALVQILVWANEAPEGWQDENGFHYGKQPNDEPDHRGRPPIWRDVELPEDVAQWAERERPR